MDIGAILGQAWSLYTRFFTRFVLVAGSVFLALGLISALIEESAGSDDGSTLVAALASVVVSIVGYFWIQGVLVVLTDDVRHGRADRPVGELFGRVRPHLGALIVAGILASLGIVLGLVALVVPGLYLLTRWSMIAPAIVIEKLSAGASFSRSHELVKGRAWNVFGLLVVLFIADALVGGIIVAIAAGVSTGFIGTWIGGAVANTVITPFIAIATTLVYFELAGARSEGDTAAEGF